MNHETQQIHDAFVDGYLSCAGNDKPRTLAAAELAWRKENVTGEDVNGGNE